MALLAYDGASAFDLNVAKQHGGIAIADYLVGHPGGYDPANEARVIHTRFLGMGPIPNWERAAGFFNACTVADARTAGAEGAAASRALGFPADGSIRVYFSFDEYVTGARFVEMGQKFDAVRAGCVGYQAAVYGQYSLINYLVTTGHAPGKHWLSGSTFNEPYNPSGPNIAMVQSHDAQGNWINTQVPGTDVNTVIDPRALGAWWPPGSPYTGGTSMALDNADKQWIHDTMVAVLRGEGVSGVAGLVATVLRSEGVSGAAGAVDPAKQAVAELANTEHGLAAMAALIKAVPGGGPGGPVTGNVTGSITITPGA